MIAAAEITEILARFGVSAGATIEVVQGGLINQTWRVGEPARFALQRVNALFPRESLERLDAVTRFLHARGLQTPRVVPSLEGSPFLPGPDGSSWRLLTWEGARTFQRLPSAVHALSAARLVARFHTLLADYPGSLHPLRPQAHDTRLHMERLSQALERCSGHRLSQGILSTGERVLSGWECWRRSFEGSEGPPRPSHGDLKISNLRFDASGEEALCLIDLDTLGSLPLSLELGDALRSWCNPAGEDQEPRLDLEVLGASMEGYLSETPWLSKAEREGIVPGLWRVALELSARFCADAFHETYFGWNPAVASGRGEHNLMRAQSQLALADLVEKKLPELGLRYQGR